MTPGTSHDGGTTFELEILETKKHNYHNHKKNKTVNHANVSPSNRLSTFLTLAE